MPAARLTVIAPGMCGFGESEKRCDGCDKVTVAYDLRALVHALGHNRIVLPGHDMGGQGAYPYAAMRPDEVRALVYIESSLPNFGQEELMDVANGGSWHLGFNMAGDIAEELVCGRERLLIEHWMRRSAVGAVDPTSIIEEALDHYAHAVAQPGGSDIDPVPTGRMLYARHPDGSVVEYVQWTDDLVERLVEAPSREGRL